MGYYKNYLCPKCNRSVSGGYRRVGVESNLGLPFVKCEHCETLSKTGKNIWSKMTKENKKDYIISQLEQAFINGIAIGMAIVFYEESILKLNDFKESLVINLLLGQFASIAIVAIWDTILIKKLEKLYIKNKFENIVM